jgi:hypothetical protein
MTWRKKMGRAEKNNFWKINKTTGPDTPNMRGVFKHRSQMQEFPKNGPAKNGYGQASDSSK